MPTAPPARPHSAHPHRALPSGLFRTSSAPRPRTSLHREAEWEADAWDSSSDKDDDDELLAADLGGMSVGGAALAGPSSSSAPTSPTLPTSPTATTTQATAKPIPIRRAPSPPTSHSNPGSGSISTSWVSASFHPTPSQNTPPGGYGSSASAAGPTQRAVVGNSTAPPAVASSSPTDEPKSPASPPASSDPLAPAPTRLPPGGAWEIVETADAAEPPAPEGVKGAEAVRPDAEDILRDPLHLLLSLSSTPASPRPGSVPGTPGAPHSGRASPIAPPRVSGLSASGVSRQRSVRTERRRELYVRALTVESGGIVDAVKLRSLAWSGIPYEVRPIVWQLLLNYLPLPVQPRLATLQRKRKEYAALVDQYFGRGPASLDQQIWHQIEIDVPRTRPGAPLWSCPATQRALERILYVWAIRHPASGYVQGINDLATPFFEVFLSGYVSVDPEAFDVSYLPSEVLAAVEADSFWCLTKLLDGIQDHYISQQPGIQRLVKRMGELIKRIDAPLANHFEEQGVEYMQFAFRWMNCLLMREITVKCTIRMWDAYLSEGKEAFSQFHLYVCCALLVKFSDRLREMDFQEIIMFLQRLPTMSWTDVDIELLLSEAFVLKNVWHGADNHFANLPNGGGGFGMLGR